MKFLKEGTGISRKHPIDSTTQPVAAMFFMGMQIKFSIQKVRVRKYCPYPWMNCNWQVYHSTVWPKLSNHYDSKWCLQYKKTRAGAVWSSVWWNAFFTIRKNMLWKHISKGWKR